MSTSTRHTPARPIIFDAIALAVFALLARIAHQSADMPLSFVGWLSTLWPFLIGLGLGWLLLSRATAPTMVSGARNGRGAAIVWLCTVVVGLVIWALRNGTVPHWSFVLVASATSALFMFGWRAAATLASSRK